MLENDELARSRSNKVLDSNALDSDERTTVRRDWEKINSVGIGRSGDRNGRWTDEIHK